MLYENNIARLNLNEFDKLETLPTREIKSTKKIVRNLRDNWEKPLGRKSASLIHFAQFLAYFLRPFS
jgi:hypothetical protein